MFTSRKKIVVAIAAVLSMSSPVYAAEETKEEDESAGVVIVTTQKRAQNIQDVSVAVTAFMGEEMRELNMTNSIDIAAQTPGLNIGTPVGEGNNASISLRGVGLNDFNDNNEGPIAVYRDDVYQSAMPGLTFQLFDLERVEVLRGPQGTLYGRNATGGLVHFISKRPDEEFEGYFDLTFAEYSQIKLEGAIGGSLSENIQARLSIASNNHDGYVKNRIGKDANEADSVAYRLQFNFDFNDDFNALVNIHGGETDTIAPQYQHEATADGVDFYGYTDTDGDVWAGDYDREGILNIESKGFSVTVDWNGDDIAFTSITAAEDVEKIHQEDTDVGPFAGIEPQFISENEQFSQEFRFTGQSGAVQWLAGLFYFENEVTGALDIDVNYPGPIVDGITGAPPGTFGTDLVPFFNYDVDYLQKTDSSGLFGQLEYEISERFTLIAGLRYTQEERSMNYQNRTDGNPDALLNFCLITPGDVCDFGLGGGWPGTDTYLDFTSSNPAVGGLNKINNNNLSGKIGLDYHPDEDVLVFFNVSKGFKSGGFNGGFLDFTDGIVEADVPFEEENLTSYEAGLKSTLADGAIRFNATVFYYDYKDYQALTFSGLSQFITNADATVQGLDMELTFLESDDWDVSLGASFLDTEVDQVSIRGGQTFTNTQMVQAPELSFNGVIRYYATEDLSFQIDFNHQGEQFFDITNSDVSKEGAYTVFNARVGYQVNDDLNISAYIKNLTNEEYRVYSFDFTGPAGLNQNFYAPPSWYGVTFSYLFGG